MGGLCLYSMQMTQFCSKKAEESALRNLKCILMLYEQLSGMRVNFHKSELLPINLDLEDTHRFAHIFFLPSWLLSSEVSRSTFTF